MRPWVKLWSALAIGLTLQTAPLQAEFAYVANFLDIGVSAYHIGPDGSLTPVVGSPFPAERLAGSVAVDLLGRFAYVATAGGSEPDWPAKIPPRAL